MTRQRGAALAGVIFAGALIGALGVVLAFSTWSRLAGARFAHAQAESLHFGRGVLSACAGWFEAEERGSIVDPPDALQVLRARRALDGARYKERGGDLFRPPDGPASEHRFLGSAEVPDVLLEREGRGSEVLERLEEALGAPETLRIERLAFFAPAWGARAGTIATAQCVIETRRDSRASRRVVLQADLWLLPWDELSRPLVVEGDAHFVGEAAWRAGDAWFGGDLVSDADAEAFWPSAMPWNGPDEPLLDDHDGDGFDDDVDGDGRADLAAWRDAPGDTEDPWWRGRVGGSWNAESPGAPCAPLRPFGPRAVPPLPVDKAGERSALVAGCGALGLRALPPSWRAIASLDSRGVIRARESPDSPGFFVPESGTDPRPPGHLLRGRGGVVFLEALAARDPLEITLEGGRGAFVVRGRDVTLRPGLARGHERLLPEDPRSTGGIPRRPTATDRLVPLTERGAACSSWGTARWREPVGLEGTARACPPRGLHFEGLVATDGHIQVQPGTRVAGQLRAASLRVEGGAPATLIEARSEGIGLDRSRPGPPGAPRVVARGVRRVRR